jgi:hypothetical protein
MVEAAWPSWMVVWKAGKVGGLEILRRGIYVELVTQLLRPTVYGEMLRRGNHLQIFWVVPLQSGDEGQPHARC